ncbi:glutathione ABC transporter substrate-binding protein [Shouchella lonarensis]|uniref:Peptide/nickel transport system substrate-binding protein n=1 Tax=Shouchella lonarensis TaxID=1464122 RepID=A0A1G6NS68_9BACI|nr:glutathione ABC transporter substrate-binding protein [Shouchella lonarensis]SDC70156.1 peptide/nickel transport system substrate-binding protein [Shouchella lonarensis]
MKPLKKSVYGVCALALAVGLAACSSEPTDDGKKKEGEGNGAAGSGEGGDLVIAMMSAPVNLDPHGVGDVASSQIQDLIYERLIQFDENRELEPVLAKDWKEEGNKLTFELQEGIKFHDGEDFNAEVVKKNIERIKDEDLASQRAFLFEKVSEINVLGDYEIEFVTEEPFVPLVYSFAHSGGSMISPASIDADYEAIEAGAKPYTKVSEKPAGTGYFKYDSGVAGSSEIVLKKNEDYRDGPPKLDSVTFKHVKEASTRLAEVESGNSHIADSVEVSLLNQLDNMQGAHLSVTDGIAGSYYGFNAKKKPFDNPDVRRAIAMAIDNKVIVDNIWNGQAILPTGPIPPGVFGYDESIQPLPYDPEKAKELLDKAGVKDLSFSITTNDNPQRKATAEYMQSELGKLGINVEVKEQEWATFLEATANGEHDMFILGWGAATGDGDYALEPLFHTDRQGAPGNRSFYSNTELDEILDQAAREEDEKVRLDLYKKAQEIVIEDAPVVYTNYTKYLKGIRDEVKNVRVDADDKYNLYETYIEK